jgi:hypothetical protein
MKLNAIDRPAEVPAPLIWGRTPHYLRCTGCRVELTMGERCVSRRNPAADLSERAERRDWYCISCARSVVADQAAAVEALLAWAKAELQHSRALVAEISKRFRRRGVPLAVRAFKRSAGVR